MAVRGEEDLLVLRDRAHDLLGVRGGDDDVGKRLHRRRAVDVGQRHRARVRLPPGAEGVRRAGVLEGAPRLVVGEDDLPGRVENLGRLGHEPDAGERDDPGVALLRLAGQVERVADEVGEILDRLFLVVVGQQDCVFLSLEREDLGFQIEARIDRRDVRRRRTRRKRRIGRHSRGRAHGLPSIARTKRKRLALGARNFHGWHGFCFLRGHEHGRVAIGAQAGRESRPVPGGDARPRRARALGLRPAFLAPRRVAPATPPSETPLVYSPPEA